MIKVIIIDDERHCITTLQHHLKNIQDIDIVAVTQDSGSAKNLILTHQPHLVFMDIDMPMLNGFEVLAQFEKIDFQVVFVTAYNQYAIKAIKINALDYLLKPVDKNDILEVIERYRESKMRVSEAQLTHAQHFIQHKISDTLALSTQDGLVFIKIEDIMYLEADSSYTIVILQDGTKHLVSKTMSNFGDALEGNPHFFRAHKSFIINLKCIKQYIRGEGGEIIMKNGKSIALSRNKKQDFLNFFQKI